MCPYNICILALRFCILSQSKRAEPDTFPWQGWKELNGTNLGENIPFSINLMPLMFFLFNPWIQQEPDTFSEQQTSVIPSEVVG